MTYSLFRRNWNFQMNNYWYLQIWCKSNTYQMCSVINTSIMSQTLPTLVISLHGVIGVWVKYNYFIFYIYNGRTTKSFFLKFRYLPIIYKPIENIFMWEHRNTITFVSSMIINEICTSIHDIMLSVCPDTLLLKHINTPHAKLQLLDLN